MVRSGMIRTFYFLDIDFENISSIHADYEDKSQRRFVRPREFGEENERGDEQNPLMQMKILIKLKSCCPTLKLYQNCMDRPNFVRSPLRLEKEILANYWNS